MRIIGGKFKGRRLTAPEDARIRPTSDRAREALFDILAHGRHGIGIDGARVLDAFAGTGALGLEALSRGAAEVTFLESQPKALALIRTNLETLKAASSCPSVPLHLVQGDATRPPPCPLAGKAGHDLAFLDPPYGQGLLPPALTALSTGNWLAEGALVIAECAAREPLAAPAGFTVLDERRFGAARLVFLRHAA